MRRDKRVVQMMKDAKRGPCILCNSPAVHSVLFIPDNQLEFGGHPGKTRILAYGLCQKCFSDPSSMDRAENIIKAGS